ncbi:general transcription factor IIE subunit 1 [Sphaerodactylus townsendi]|uniref:general transcription factor IIE subunit 1 n=1 Tax=Sphaerodactylus townsendi TaxID=933632 RepID=UPI0020269973|nr:general transcription factor IIE subunit 1 [Sphaerodactylus townsendi]
MTDPDVLTEVPAALKRLAKYVVRGFYGTEHALALDILIRNPCVKEEDMLELLKFDRKQLRAVLNTLKGDKFIKCRMRVETAPDGKTTRHNYYFINYRLLVNVVKYKLDHMRRRIETDERDSTNRASFRCPVCFSTFTDLEANQLFDPMTGPMDHSHSSEAVKGNSRGCQCHICISVAVCPVVSFICRPCVPAGGRDTDMFQEGEESQGALDNNEEVMRALLIHEKKTPSASVGALGGAAPLSSANASDSESETSESDDDSPPRAAAATLYNLVEEDDDEFEVVTEDPTIMVAGRPFSYSQVNQRPELVAQMTPEEKELYIAMGQRMFEDMYE